LRRSFSGGELAHQLGRLLLFEVHDGIVHHEDWVQYPFVHAEGALVVLLALTPLLEEEGLSTVSVCAHTPDKQIYQIYSNPAGG
jgi:hypothetical protein